MSPLAIFWSLWSGSIIKRLGHLSPEQSARVSHPNCGGESDLIQPPNLRDRPECRTGAVNERCIQSRSNNYSPGLTCFLNRNPPFDCRWRKKWKNQCDRRANIQEKVLQKFFRFPVIVVIKPENLLAISW